MPPEKIPYAAQKKFGLFIVFEGSGLENDLRWILVMRESRSGKDIRFTTKMEPVGQTPEGGPKPTQPVIELRDTRDQRESCWGSICLKIDIPDPLADKFLYLMRAAVEAFILPDGTMTEAFKDSGSWIVFCLDMFAEVDDELITRDELVFLDQQTMLDLYSVENQLEDLAQTIVPDADWFFMRGPAYQPEAGVPSQPPMWYGDGEVPSPSFRFRSSTFPQSKVSERPEVSVVSL